MTFRDQLEKLDACNDSLEWVKGKTIEQAWKTCEYSEWMLWFLTKTDLDLTDPLCDIAEGVLHLVPEEGKLACSNAINSARRRDSKDKLNSAVSTAAGYAVRSIAAAAAYYASRAATAAAAVRSCSCNAAYSTASNAANARCAHVAYAAHAANALTDAANALTDAAGAAYSTAYRKERKKQCDIFRKYFTITQVKKAFKKLVA